jgi:hypothetical protein
VLAAPASRRLPGVIVALALIGLAAAVAVVLTRSSGTPLAGPAAVRAPASAAHADGSSPAPTLAWPADVPYVASPGPAADVPTSSASRTGAALAPVAPRTVEDIVATSMPAVVLIQSSGGRGTGFYVAADRIVTNAHVVGQAGYVTIATAWGARATTAGA